MATWRGSRRAAPACSCRCSGWAGCSWAGRRVSRSTCSASRSASISTAPRSGSPRWDAWASPEALGGPALPKHLDERLGLEAELEQGHAGVRVLAVGDDLAALEIEHAHALEPHGTARAARNGGRARVGAAPFAGGAAAGAEYQPRS